MRAISDLIDYKRILPYDSEIFGVYQPLLGWRSKRVMARVSAGFSNDISAALTRISRRLSGDVDLKVNADNMIETARVQPAGIDPRQPQGTSTFVMQTISEQLPALADYTPDIWDSVLSRDTLEKVLNDVAVPRAIEWQRTALNTAMQRGPVQVNQMLADQLNSESLAAGYLLQLKTQGKNEQLKQLFYANDLKLANLMQLSEFTSPLDYIDPFKDIDRVSLSPIGIVHLYRQFFFEFDTFLGSPVGHVWLSPGSTVELVEVTTRKTIVEKVLESEIETTVKTEKSTTDEDELSSAVKEDNKSDTKFGASATVNQGWITGSATATATIDLATTQGKAREENHRHMRQQSDKLSTEIRKNYKSTFRTVTETTDMSSKRYVLANTTHDLINYELRRKMRQVGVQVQDVGTYLCWQTYVDDPGRQLGVSKLVHIATEPDVGKIPPPESVPAPAPVTSTMPIDIPFVQASEDQGDLDEGYRNGVEVDTDFNEGDVEKINWRFGPFTAFSPQAGFTLQDAVWNYQGCDVQLSLIHDDSVTDPPGTYTFALEVNYVNFRGNSPIRVALDLTWAPSQAMLDAVTAQNAANVATYSAATQREFEKAFLVAAAQRVTAASKIGARPFDDLREEERIVVYRSLIQSMLTKGIPMPDDRTRHVVSELLNTIFDIDKMLYFVAPEWWRPRLHQSHQGLGAPKEPPAPPGGAPPGQGTTAKHASVYTEVALAAKKPYAAAIAAVAAAEDTQIPTTSTVSWGGVGEGRGDNYYITSDSDDARMGSSLGWLLQLDGDNLRNAFLNAPWVKAVIPVRPGQEQAAINWLSRVNVEGAEGLDDAYVAPPDLLADIPHAGATPTIREAIDHLCELVAAKHRTGMTVSKFPPDEINDDQTVMATPLDKVYEHGFYPLKGGFRITPDQPFEVFDQWVEILPTDQVVPVEVSYDPKTGRQI